MTWPAYPDYAQADVEWVDAVPSSWSVLAAKRVIARIESGTSVNAMDVPASPGEIAVLKTSCVYSGEFAPNENKTVADPVEMARVTCPLVAGTMIVSRMNTPDLVGAAAYVSESVDGLFLPDRLWQVTFNADVEARWMHYWTKTPSYRDQLRAICVGTSSSMQNISQGDFGALEVAIPSVKEQQAIVDFLDRETEMIDALIGKQEQLIATLREDRTATITHAVTKGLDPDVEMKESGVECIGPLPSTWSVRRLKSLGSIRYGIGEPPKYVENGTPLIRATNVSKGAILPEGLVYVNPDDIPAARIYWLQEGDILVVRSGAYTGDSAIVAAEYSGAIAGFDMVFRAASAVPLFVQYVLLSAYCKDAQIDTARARAAQPHLNAQELGNCLVATPPVDVQESIVSFLNARCSKIDALIAKAGDVIHTLREYRSALITDAVTGKIDVRRAA